MTRKSATKVAIELLQFFNRIVKEGDESKAEAEAAEAERIVTEYGKQEYNLGWNDALDYADVHMD